MKTTPDAGLTIHGAWHGAVGDPTRRFKGKISVSNLSEYQVGTAVEIRYETTDSRIPGAKQHGTYCMRLAGKDVKLMTFTCRSEATSGKEGQDDQAPADWQAVPLPEQSSSPL